MELLRLAFGLHEHSVAVPSFSDLPTKAVSLAISATDHKGSDVRLALGEVMKPSVWPRRPMQSHLWSWQNVFSWRWQNEGHITDLELRAAVLAVAWRLRQWKNCGQRCLHLVDNQAALAVMTKGRSSSHALSVSLVRLNALLLFSCSVLHVGYVETDANPADAGSRQRDA
eukprot:6489958-Amphidinium_carterae.2